MPLIKSAARPAKYRARGGRTTIGALTGSTGGRADKLPLTVPDHSHVIPADVVSALGQGNSAHGMHVLKQMFPTERKIGGKTTDIMASDGEYVISPSAVEKIGKGDIEHGHKVLDHFILHVRHQNIKHLQNLPGPSK